MLGKTHVAVGIASSLIILHPTTIPEILSTIAGGTLGGWICDIDCRDPKSNGLLAGITFTFLITGSSLLLDYIVGNGICDYIKSNWGILSIAGLTIFILCCILSFLQAHRTFSHSILALFLMGSAMLIFCKPLCLPFIIGFISHIMLDLTNKKGIQLFYPIKKRICFSWCSSNGKTDIIIRQVASLISVLTGAILSIIAISEYYSGLDFFSTLRKNTNFFNLSYFQLYFISINIITFIVFCLDALVYMFTTWEDDEDYGQDFIHTILNFLGIFGGAYGMLLSFLVMREKISRLNANWYAIAISLAEIWTVMYMIICDPFYIGFGGINQSHFHLPLLLYLIFVNLISFILFYKDRNSDRRKWCTIEALMFNIGILGGTLGGILAMIITGSKKNYPHFSFGFPVLTVGHVFVVGYLILAGIA